MWDDDRHLSLAQRLRLSYAEGVLQSLKTITAKYAMCAAEGHEF